VIPPESNAGFVAAIEDVLEVYHRPHEYTRNGTANLFMMFAPLEGWRHVEVTDRHTAIDYAEILKDISDNRFPEAEKMVHMCGQSGLRYGALEARYARFAHRDPSGASRPTLLLGLRSPKIHLRLTKPPRRNIIASIRGSRRRVADIKPESRPASYRNAWPASSNPQSGRRRTCPARCGRSAPARARATGASG
jgi:hypothetical protein